MTELIKYEAARAALAAVQSYDEVKDIMDAAERRAVYARQAQDNEMVAWATEIRVRSQRRAGEMLAETEKAVGAKGIGKKSAVDSNDRTFLTLAEMGITKDQSSNWQALASMSPEHFEATVAAAKETAGEVATAFMVREAKARLRLTEKPKKTHRKRKLSKRDKVNLEKLDAAHQKDQAGLNTETEAGTESVIKPAVEAMPNPDADQMLEDAHGDVDWPAALAEADQEIHELRELLDAARADDQKKEVIRWREAFQGAERRRDEAQAAAVEAEKYKNFLERELSACGKAVGVKNLDEIAKAVKAFVRQHKRVEA